MSKSTTISNHALVGDGFNIILQPALAPFVARELQARYKTGWWNQTVYSLPDQTRLKLPKDGDAQAVADEFDAAALLYLIDRLWGEVFATNLPKIARTHAIELRDLRNKWAHHAGADLTPDDCYRALDTMTRFLENFDKPASRKTRALAQTVQKSIIAAAETPSSALSPGGTSSVEPGILMPGLTPGTPMPGPLTPGTPTPGPPSSSPPPRPAQASLGLNVRPWRDVVQPHPDVAAGNYQTAEFAADLAQVLAGNATADYGDPHQFFARTFLTEGMSRLLASALKRISAAGGDPVIQLKTAFGGGKTHTMLALFHVLREGTNAAALPGVAPVISAAGVEPAALPRANVAVLVGTDLGVAEPRLDAAGNGVLVRTLWGELAAQLGGAPAYAIVRADDEAGVAPGANKLVELMTRFGPAVVLIDEFVAYARNIYGKDNLPAGSFESNLTFIQSLTEAAKRARNGLVIASIPESDKEVGGQAGKEAQARLEQIFGRVETVWKPVAAREGFEIVRRRLFAEVGDPAARDAACRAFHKLYNNQTGDFPPEAGQAAYLERLKSAYPIHPEVFDRLYDEWATLEEFQRTRGVLRLMAGVIHVLWSSGDQSPLILPGSLPLDHPSVRTELLRYLPETWNTVVDKDVDGDHAEPRAVDRSQNRFGQIGAARRLARAIFLGSAPHVSQQGRRGVEAPRIRLGVVQPNEGIATYNDALGQLRDHLTYLYSGDQRYWYDTRPNLNRTADERAAAIEPYKVVETIRARLEAQKGRGDFAGVHRFAESADVPDIPEARLVILRPDAGHRQRQTDSAALRTARDVLEMRGSAPRLHKNMLLFVAPDEAGAAALEQIARRFLAWQSIEQDADTLNLDAHGRRQARDQREKDDRTLNDRLNEAYRWLLIPQQGTDSKWTWDVQQINGSSPVVDRAALKLRQTEQLITKWSAPGLKIELDRWLWKEADHVETRRLWDALANYGYLPRLKDESVLLDAIATGLAAPDYFAYARSRSADGRYEGLIFNTPTLASALTIDSYSLLVKPDVARRQQEADEARARQLEQERATYRTDGGTSSETGWTNGAAGTGTDTGIDGDLPVPPSLRPSVPPPPPKLRRFYGSVALDAKRIHRDAGQVADEIVQHLAALPGASVTVTLDIEAHLPDGAPDDVVRAVLENANTLKFRTKDFEES